MNLKSMFKLPVKLVTHNNTFHVDDIFACATLQLYLDKTKTPYEVIRTRDMEIIEKGDYVFDVGDIYDPETNRYDHHQPGGAGARANGIQYASFGLVWKHFGSKLCSQEVADDIDVKIVSGIDAIDNGVSITIQLLPDVFPLDYGIFASSFKPSWKDNDLTAFDTGFDEIVEISKKFLARQITYLEDLKEAEILVEQAYKNAEDKRIIILDHYSPGKSKLALHPEPLFVIYPNKINKTWMVSAVRDDENTFISRKNFPAGWSGLRDKELGKISGVPDAVFCHRALFLVAAKSEHGAIELAKKALES